MTSTNPARSDLGKREYVLGVIRSVYESHGFESAGTAERFQSQIVGDDKSVEANAILAVNETLNSLGIKHFAIYLSHSHVLADILEAVRVPEPLRQQTVAAIRRFRKFNVEGFVNELQEAGISERASTVLADLFLNTDEILNQEHDVNRTIVGNLLNIVNSETLTELGQILRLTGRTPVLIDPALSCEPPYGEGIIIEVRTSGLETLGSGGIVEDKTIVFEFETENMVDLMDS